jgi:hypothetical protein
MTDDMASILSAPIATADDDPSCRLARDSFLCPRSQPVIARLPGQPVLPVEHQPTGCASGDRQSDRQSTVKGGVDVDIKGT